MEQVNGKVRNMELKDKSRKTAFIGMYAAIAIVLSYIEMLLPITIGIPGAKPGFANIIIVFAIYSVGGVSAFIINFIRILIIGMMFGNFVSIAFSICGALVSLMVMLLVKRIKGIHPLGVSICGGVSHNLGQILAASFLVKNYSILYYLPMLMIAGVLSGIIIGIVSGLMLKRLNHMIK